MWGTAVRKIIMLVATALVAVTLTGAPASAKGTPDKYVPKAGPSFNNPYGTQPAVRRLISQVNRTIDSVPRGGKIRISAWNVRSAAITNALIRAHQRKVSVQVVMDRANWNPNNPNVTPRASGPRSSRATRAAPRRRRASCAAASAPAAAGTASRTPSSSSSTRCA